MAIWHWNCTIKYVKNPSGEQQMRGFLINKNLCLYYWLRKRVGKKWAFKLAIGAEKVILIFGREPMRDLEHTP